MTSYHYELLSMSTSNLANGTSMIDAACIAFHKSVSAFITKSHKRNRHRPREHGDDYDDDGRGDGDDTNANDVDDNAAKCIELVEHANHVLRTLFAKRLSLQNAILAFREASELYAQQFGAATTTCTSIESEVNNNAIRQEDDRQRQIILRNWFANCIRLRRGGVDDLSYWRVEGDDDIPTHW